jgi:ribosomal-protein-alanine N-acetyltransferase
MWSAFDEAHITTIAIDEPYRGRGLGEWMLATVFDEAVRRGANWLTLEVRVSNASAQTLYRKWGFSVQGTRRRYYSDNNEDALIMWSRALNDDAYVAERSRLRQTLFDRLGDQIAAGDAIAARR